MEERPVYAPFSIEFNHKKLEKYLYSPRSFGSIKEKRYNPIQAQKQRANLLSEIKKSSLKVASHLKNSDQINRLIAIHIDNQSALSTFPDLKNDSSFKGSYVDINRKDKSLSSVRGSNKQNLTFNKKKEKLSNNNLSINEDLVIAPTYKTIILPEINCAHSISIPVSESQSISNKRMKREVENFEQGNLAEKITEREKNSNVNYLIKSLSEKVSSKPKENAVDKFFKAIKHFGNNHRYENDSTVASFNGTISKTIENDMISTRRHSIERRIFTFPCENEHEPSKNSSIRFHPVSSVRNSNKRDTNSQVLGPLKVLFFFVIIINLLKENKRRKT